ncbi:MAG: hypothetical protein KKB13_03410, partial [Chloroflexi bacterium]|nr:hypothetical protein [Chloroflexota bacterium]
MAADIALVLAARASAARDRGPEYHAALGCPAPTSAPVALGAGALFQVLEVERCNSDTNAARWYNRAGWSTGRWAWPGLPEPISPS